MKVAIIYSGAFNLIEITYKSHKEKIFDYMQENNIDFDLYCSLSNECVYKDPNLEKLIKFTKIVNNKINKNQNFNYDNYENLSYDYKGFTFYYNNEEIINIIKKCYSNINDDKIKYIDFIDNFNGVKVANEMISNNITINLHNNQTLTYTTFYKRILNLDYQIINEEKNNNFKYDFYIYLRTDYLFYDEFELNKCLINNIITASPHQMLNNTIRPDYLWISNTKFTNHINDDNIKKMNIVLDEEQLKHIKKIKQIKDPYEIYYFLKSQGLNINLNFYGNRIGVWEYFSFLPPKENKKYFI